MPGLRKTALDVFSVHDTADRLAAEPLPQGLEFRDQGGKNIVGMQQVDRDEMLGDQDFAKRRIGVDPIAEQSAGEIVAFSPCHDNAGLPGATGARRTLGESQPRGQVESRNSLPDQWVDSADLIARQGLNGE